MDHIIDIKSSEVFKMSLCGGHRSMSVLITRRSITKTHEYSLQLHNYLSFYSGEGYPITIKYYFLIIVRNHYTVNITDIH